MSLAVMDMADGLGTSEEHLAGYHLARLINRAAGGTVVAPWEVGQLPEEWVDAGRALLIELPGIVEGRKQVAERVAKMKKERGWQ